MVACFVGFPGLAAVGGAPLLAQDSSAPPLAAAIQLRVVPATVYEFSERICPDGEVVPEVRLTSRPLAWLALTVGAGVHTEPRLSQCENGLHFPPPDSGTATLHDYSEVEGYPYYSATVRAAVERPMSRRARWRVFTGLEWLPGKELMAFTAGLGASVQLGGGTMFIVELERRQFNVPHVVVTTDYFGGQPVNRTRRNEDRLEVQGALRIGLELAIRR